MKKIFAIMLVLAVFSIHTAAISESYSEKSVDELMAIMHSVRTELMFRENSVTQADVLLENENVAIYLDKGRPMGVNVFGELEIPVILVNNTNDEMGFSIRSVMINGWECDGYIGSVTSAGKKRSEMKLDHDGAGISSVEEIEDIQVILGIFNMDRFEDELKSDRITLVIENGQILKKE